jgi:hypothetical protein
MTVVADDVLTPLDPDADLVSRRRARKWWIAVAVFGLVGAVAMAWAGQKSNPKLPPAPAPFCKAAKRYEAELQRQQIAYKRDLGRQITYVEAIAATAPKKVQADAQTFLDSLRALQDAPNERAKQALKDDPTIKQAVVNVNRYWNQRCGVFDRKSGI